LIAWAPTLTAQRLVTGVLAVNDLVVADAAECPHMQPAARVVAHDPRLRIWGCRRPIALERVHL